MQKHAATHAAASLDPPLNSLSPGTLRFVAAIRDTTLQSVGGTSDAECSPIQHVRVDHRRADVRMAEQLLHPSNIGPILEQVDLLRPISVPAGSKGIHSAALYARSSALAVG